MTRQIETLAALHKHLELCEESANRIALLKVKDRVETLVLRKLWDSFV